MHRGLTTYLSLTGMLLFLFIALSSLHTTKFAGLNIYYNENGDSLYSEACDTSGTYVIKTCKTVVEIFPVKDSNETESRAWVKNISISTAAEVEKLIREGRTKEKLVRDNIVPIFNKSIIQNMRKLIKDNGKGGSIKKNNREYGGLLDSIGTITYVNSGKIVPVCNKGRNVAVSFDTLQEKRAKAEFHSHPSGCGGILEPWPCTGFEDMPGPCGHTQGPSYKDQIAAERRTAYVFAMRAKLIFIYDNKGVKATLPFSFLEEKKRAVSVYR